jgi:hypothetical protein
VSEDEQQEFRILTGPWVSTREFAQALEEALASADDVEGD